MNKSEDVSKLFAMFGEKNTDQYQEIYEAEQNQAARGRWPVFQRVLVETERATSPAKPVAPTTRVDTVPAPQGESAPCSSTSPEKPTTTNPAVQDSIVAAEPVVTATPVTQPNPEPVRANDIKPAATMSPRPITDTMPTTPTQTPAAPGTLRTLFKRLEGQPEEPVVVTPEVPPAPEPAQGSIRSLFSRLSR